VDFVVFGGCRATSVPIGTRYQFFGTGVARPPFLGFCELLKFYFLLTNYYIFLNYYFAKKII